MFERATAYSLFAVLPRHSCRLVRCAGPAFHIARTNTCREISGYSGIPDHIEIRWANDRDHGTAFCCDPLWRLIGSRCESLAESLYLCNIHVLRGMRAVVARATMYLHVYATNLYRHASTRVYRVNRHERETPADGRFKSFSTYLPFTSLSYLYVDRGLPPAIEVIIKLQVLYILLRY